MLVIYLVCEIALLFRRDEVITWLISQCFHDESFHAAEGSGSYLTRQVKVRNVRWFLISCKKLQGDDENCNLDDCLPGRMRWMCCDVMFYSWRSWLGILCWLRYNDDDVNVLSEDHKVYDIHQICDECRSIIGCSSWSREIVSQTRTWLGCLDLGCADAMNECRGKVSTCNRLDYFTWDAVEKFGLEPCL